MADIVLLHNNACSTSRDALSKVEAAGVDVEVVPYLRRPLDRAQLLALMAKLDDPPADLVRKDGLFDQLGLAADAYTTPDAVADLLVDYPRLMQRPVLIRGDRAIIGRPKHRVDKFLTA
jgi:arsenate reductase (glutaredoxin)